MKILVTGGTGFIGSNLASHLSKENYDLLITGNEGEQKVEGFKGKHLGSNFMNIDWDSINKIDILFHQAAINDTTLLDRKEMFRVNFYAAKELFKKSTEKGCKRIVYASSTAVYGNLPTPYKEDGLTHPLNPYAESKKLLDDFAMQFADQNPDIVIVGLRYCNVYGPGEQHKGKRASMVYQLARQMLNSNPRLFKYGEQKRDYIYIKDVVEANVLASKATQSCIINCGFGKSVSFNSLVEILNKVIGTNRVPEYIDNPYEDKYQYHTECDINLARQLIGFVPKFDIESGIIDYYRNGSLTGQLP